MIIGITGGSGSGKTTLLQLIAEMGGMVLDCDRIYHRLLEEDKALLNAISARFPEAMENGSLNRKKLGAIVFADKKALEELNQLAHGAVKQEVLRLLQTQPALAAIDAIGLFEGGLAELCKLTVAVTAPEEARIQRLIRRDGITEEYARCRIKAQKSQAEFIALCDINLENNGTAEQFREKCLAFLFDLGIMKP